MSTPGLGECGASSGAGAEREGRKMQVAVDLSGFELDLPMAAIVERSVGEWIDARAQPPDPEGNRTVLRGRG